MCVQLQCHSKLGNRCFTTLYESLKVVEINSCLQVVIHVHIYIRIPKKATRLRLCSSGMDAITWYLLNLFAEWSCAFLWFCLFPSSERPKYTKRLFSKGNSAPSNWVLAFYVAACIATYSAIIHWIHLIQTSSEVAG